MSGQSSYTTMDQVQTELLDIIRKIKKMKPDDSITPDMSLTQDISLDSLETVELIMAIEEKFCTSVPDEEANKVHTVRDLLTLLSIKLNIPHDNV